MRRALEMGDVIRTRVKAGLVAILLVGGLAACGDDGDAADNGNAGGTFPSDSAPDEGTVGGDGRDEASDVGSEPGGRADGATGPGDEASGTADLSGIDACALLEQSEVQAYIGEGADIGQSEPNDLARGQGVLCGWPVVGTFGTVRLTVAHAGGDLWDSFDEMRDLMYNDTEDVEGIGDAAFLTSDGIELWFLVGDVTVGIDGVEEGSEEGLVELAHLVFDRL